MANEIKWLEVQKDYNLGIVPRELAIKYNIDENTISKHIFNNKWKEKKRNFQEKVIESQIDRLKRLTDKTLNRIEEKIDTRVIKDSDLAAFCRLVIDMSGLKSETVNNNIKKYKELDDLPTEYEMLRDTIKNN